MDVDIQGIYVIYDKVANDTVVLAMARTDGLFIRNNLPMISKINPAYEQDFEVWRVGTYRSSDKSVSNIAPELVEWDAYKFPEQKIDKD